MNMKYQLLLLLIVLLERVLTTDVGSDQDICSGQQSMDSNEYQAEPLAATHTNNGKPREEKDSKSLQIDAKEEDDYVSFVYPPLTRRTPKQPGDILEVDIGEGRKIKLNARSVNPPLFEIPNFLTDEECDIIVTASKQKGTEQSKVFTTKSDRDKGNDKSIDRVSESTLLDEEDLAYGLMDRLRSKVAKLIDMHIDVVRKIGPLVIGKYNEGGHYYAHLDSNIDSPQKPCCFQKRCSSEPGRDKEKLDCCRKCRYATVLHYLNDVEEGGETAFPLADLTFPQIQKLETTSVDWQNLTANCLEAKVRVKPEKGKSILWYNHFVDRNGYIGKVNQRTYHGGCDVLKGTKWIATHWISTPPFSQRRVPSKFRYKHV